MNQGAGRVERTREGDFMDPNLSDYRGCEIPPEIYDVAFGWDPAAEIERLLFVARESGMEPRSALELGCGTGRLLAALRERVDDAAGLELNPKMAAFAENKSGVAIHRGDMCDFELGRTFDLIYTSANTIRHICEPAGIAGLWRCIGEHLATGGVFVADLELGLAYESEKVGKPAHWMMSRGEALIHVKWEVAEPPEAIGRRTTIEWTFEKRERDNLQVWSERFPLRAYDAGEFIGFATGGGALELVGIFEPRDPYVLETPVERAIGRMMAVFRRAAAR